MRARFLSVDIVVATLLLVAALILRAQDGVQGALEETSHTALLGRRLNSLSPPILAIADFDGDKKQDGAVVLETVSFPARGFQIDLHFTGRNNSNITFQSTESARGLDSKKIAKLSAASDASCSVYRRRQPKPS